MTWRQAARTPRSGASALPAAPCVGRSLAWGRQIVKALERTGWRIEGPSGAAAMLGLKPSKLYGRMQKLGIPNHRQKTAGG
jgi:transcriptional regulator with GAF, ATPase, and Fis domain